MKRALVLGGSGKLGSNIARSLAESGFQVRVFARFEGPTPYDSDTRFETVSGDFLNDADVRAALEGQDTVFHCVWATTPASFDVEIAKDSELNLIPTVRLLQNAVDAGVSRMHFMSSGGAVYDPKFPGPYNENSPVRPISPYGVVKVASESYFSYFQDRFGLHPTIFRIGNLFGSSTYKPNLQGLISIALQRIQMGLPVMRFGDGSMERDYIHVADVAKMITQVAMGESKFNLYNIGSGVGYSVNEILDYIREVVGIDFAIEELPTPLSFPKTGLLDVRRFETEFGKPELTSIPEGIEMMWKQQLSLDN